MSKEYDESRAALLTMQILDLQALLNRSPPGLVIHRYALKLSALQSELARVQKKPDPLQAYEVDQTKKNRPTLKWSLEALVNGAVAVGAGALKKGK